MSQVREPLPPGPEGPEQAPTENSSLISLPGERSNQENTAVGDKDITQPSNNQNIQPEIQEQAVWGNHTDGDLIRRYNVVIYIGSYTVKSSENRCESSEKRMSCSPEHCFPFLQMLSNLSSAQKIHDPYEFKVKMLLATSTVMFFSNSLVSAGCIPPHVAAQPQRLPQPNTSTLERGEEETGKIRNGHVGLSNGSGIHNGVKHASADNRKLSAPVSEKMHRKIQSTLSVNSDSSKKSKISSAFSQKPGTSPEVPLCSIEKLLIKRTGAVYITDIKCRPLNSRISASEKEILEF
ncbi:myoD family inhibitor domain-containing protein isoform X6 [Apteryx rowi]|uniref:myoD family inhibitor domain-containing protein isoform X6 n=1 Tax=Apteryx rowi TaxID=308060 RepID=UPI000E1C5073|nr:myoD family inhibitor domain-containing protein isoform X6 [Apteryx rowi]